MARHPIAILLATYNGAGYLREQLDSLWGQTRQDFELIVRDDGSTDDTPDLLAAEAARRPERMRVERFDGRRLGPKAGFAHLLGCTDADWVAFCDQDDRWLPGKLQLQLDALLRLQALHGQAAPLLCSSDAAVTDAALRVAAPSYFAKHGISVAHGRDLALPRLLFRNFAIGTTTMINAPLARLCRAMPAEAVMHDWWCALMACVVGHTIVLPQAQVLYRQHGANAVGSKVHRVPRSAGELARLLSRARDNSANCIRQAQALHREVRSGAFAVAPAALRTLQEYDDFGAKSALTRTLTLLKAGSFKSGVGPNLAHLYACATAPM